MVCSNCKGLGKVWSNNQHSKCHVCLGSGVMPEFISKSQEKRVAYQMAGKRTFDSRGNEVCPKCGFACTEHVEKD